MNNLESLPINNFELLPIVLKRKILFSLPNSNIKNVSLTSKRMKNVYDKNFWLEKLSREYPMVLDYFNRYHLTIIDPKKLYIRKLTEIIKNVNKFIDEQYVDASSECRSTFVEQVREILNGSQNKDTFCEDFGYINSIKIKNYNNIHYDFINLIISLNNRNAIYEPSH